MEQPKRPAHAYACFMSAKRGELFKLVPEGEKRVPWVGKKGGELWKALAANERAPYEKQAAELRKAYEQELEKFNTQGGVMTKKRQREEGKDGKLKRRRMPKDENRPKKPTGGAWGVFLNDNRGKVMKELPQGFMALDISKEVSKRWKALTEAEQKPYQKKYEQLMQAYQEAMKIYKPPVAAEGEEDEDDDGEDEQ